METTGEPWLPRMASLKGMAVVAVMRKLLIVAAHLIQTQEDYDASKVTRAAVN